ncbi:MAG: hypothetical protein AB1714_09690 [Acidobacteriota bacterium]
MKKGAGIAGPGIHADTIGDSLDHLFGTWTKTEATRFNKSISVLEKVDKKLWP